MNTLNEKRFEVYMFEPTNKCNLNCFLCPTGNRSNKYSQGFIDPSLFEAALDQEKIDNCLIWLWGWGEPLLHPELSMLVRSSKKRNNTVEVQSNGTGSYESYKKLIEAGLDTLTISLDGMSENSIRSFRGDKVDSYDIKDKIIRLSNLCRSHHTRTSINVQCIATRFNEHEIQDVQNWALSVARADKFNLKTLCLGEINNEKARTFLPINPSLTRYHVNENGLVTMPERSEGMCNFLRGIRVTLWDFTVVPCCYDFAGEYSFGNLLAGYDDREFMGRYAKGDVHICKICPEMRIKDKFVCVK